MLKGIVHASPTDEVLVNGARPTAPPALPMPLFRLLLLLLLLLPPLKYSLWIHACAINATKDACTFSKYVLKNESPWWREDEMKVNRRRATMGGGENENENDGLKLTNARERRFWVSGSTCMVSPTQWWPRLAYLLAVKLFNDRSAIRDKMLFLRQCTPSGVLGRVCGIYHSFLKQFIC